jgi:aryl-alcohol dehydrogenase-like predicted oxidoreductase
MTFMRYRPLGRTGQYVSEICLGAMTFAGGAGFWRAIGSLDQKATTALVSRALEAGLNFIDTANVYSEGQSEVQLGQALRDLSVRREDVIIATKVRSRMGPGPNAVGLSRGHIMDQIAASLKRLGLDHVDLYQIHGFDPVTPMEETLRALDDCVSRGLVTTIGCSNLAAWQIMKALGISDKRGYARFETVQAYYSIAGRELEREIVPLVEDQGLGIMVWSPLAGGFLSGQVHPREARRQRLAAHHVRFSARRQGARLRHYRGHGVDRQGARRVGRPRRARLAARAQGRDERDHRREDHRSARRQSCRRRSDAERG